MDSWVSASQKYNNIHIIQYEQLVDNYEYQVNRICDILKTPLRSNIKPDRTNYIKIDKDLPVSEEEKITILTLISRGVVGVQKI